MRSGRKQIRCFAASAISRGLLITISLVVFQVFHGVAAAALAACGTSIDSQAAYTDLVVIGQIVSSTTVEKQPVGVPSNYRPWSVMTVEVHQVLKGHAPEQIIFGTRIASSKYPHAAIFFLMAGARYARFDPAAAGMSWAAEEPVDLSEPSSFGVLSTDLRNGLSPGRIIELVKAHCGFGIVPNCETIVTSMNYRDGWPSILNVSLDPENERIARQWAGSVDPTTRWNAARILLNSRSAENIAALQHIANFPVDSTTAYLARALALDQLQRWGIGMQPLAVSPAAVSFLRHAGLLLAFSALLSAAYFFRSRRPYRCVSRFSSTWRSAVILVVCILLFFGSASYFEGAGFSSGHGEIAILQGSFILIHRQHRAISRNEPWRFFSTNDLWAVRDFCDGRYDRGSLPGMRVSGILSFQAPLYPEWDLYGISIPIWGLTLCVLLIPATVFATTAIRKAIDNRCRGFPILLSGNAPLLNRIADSVVQQPQ